MTLFTPYDLENPPAQQDKTNEIIKSLSALLDSMKKNKSVISKMADGWGELSIWIKIGGGLVVFGSLLLIGIFALSTVLIVSTCICSLLYTLVSLGLDNHHATNRDEHDKLKSKIVSLGSFLSLIIDKLNITSFKLATQVELLNNSVGGLNGLIEKTTSDFESEVSNLKIEVDAFRKHNEILECMVKSIASCSSKNQESNMAFSESLGRLINEAREGNSDLFKGLTNLLSLEKDLKASLLQNEALLTKYNRLVEQHQQKLDLANRGARSIGVQTEKPALHAGRILDGIITTAQANNNFSSLSLRTLSCNSFE